LQLSDIFGSLPEENKKSIEEYLFNAHGHLYKEENLLIEKQVNPAQEVFQLPYYYFPCPL
jgi:hypothetical protein